MSSACRGDRSVKQWSFRRQTVQHYVSVFPISLPSDSSQTHMSLATQLVEGVIIPCGLQEDEVSLPTDFLEALSKAAPILSRPVISLVIHMCQLLLDRQLSLWLAVQMAHWQWEGRSVGVKTKKNIRTEDTDALIKGQIIPEIWQIHKLLKGISWKWIDIGQKYIVFW